MFSFTKTLAIAAALATSVYAQVAPTSPDANTVAQIGSQLTTTFTKDTTGKWNNVSIDLMSGDNFHMIPVANLATGIDGTTTTEYTFTVPDVSPTSKIYFLQFSPNDGVLADVTWTTRFTIAGEDGSTTPPVNSTQPGTGASIPWGIGQLAGSTPSSASSSADAIASASSVTSSAAAVVTASSSVEAMTMSSASSMAQVVSSSSAASPSSTSPTSATGSIAAAAATSSGAAGKVEMVGMGFMGVVVGLVGLVL